MTFVADTSKSKLDAAQIALAKSLGLVPLPSSEYMKVPKGDKGVTPSRTSWPSSAG
ncbi:hypothetical protein [Streptomyces sp. ISL-94]|uniref:hypothetical protein n=1 Tax=Streptomyces sp. ISL-94 TaxID=2819190 RepID=UPI001BE58FF5|nr:hypothetical protein [Streptomyces sp. ISL-94]MBT2478184.1 hypothetical protein [Streptomyces sp. ISL-94]